MTEPPLTRRRRLTTPDDEDDARTLTPSERMRLRDEARRADARRREHLIAEGRAVLAEYLTDDGDLFDAMRRFMADLADDQRRADRWGPQRTPDPDPRTVSERMAHDIGGDE